MRIAIWHVHGSWHTPFVTGPDEYLLPVLPDRGPDGRGRAQSWDWPASARELAPEQLRAEGCDVVVLQRPHGVALFEEWTGRRPGVDVPAVYVEHNTPAGDAVRTRHPLADRSDIPVVHVTHFNALMWDTGRAPTRVVEHGVLDPGHLYTGAEERLGVVVNEPVRRWRVAGTDIVVDLSQRVPVTVYGMGMDALAERAPHLTGHLHENVRQDRMHRLLARQRAYLHPYRWTSLGLSLIEAMMLGLPVLALATTAAPGAVPADAGVVSGDPDVLEQAAQRWLADPDEARERGQAARRHATHAFAVDRFLADWQSLLEEVVG
ncbi:glycosyltransferase [uncultured Georgenia sp.]|uniref:glycosyltransferase n=1 Tax=uncultured Georgenia sp. TaxID=378209 RepID=UPI00260ABBC2|nr:glycosyltransferase [uncultured Georgenia sp.]